MIPLFLVFIVYRRVFVDVENTQRVEGVDGLNKYALNINPTVIP
ncbi:MAG: hypothetical protein H6Q67_1961 [Firmicutes bacterium]|nr:hypothetical protein [Bacillota bacterium]